MNIELHNNNTLIPSRTKFQLHHFVIEQHDTKPMQWRQVLLEANDLTYKIRSAEIQMQKTKIEHDRLIATGDELDALDAEQKRLDMSVTERALKAARLELCWLEEIAEQIGPYTFEEIEENQPEYWAKRLQRQADMDVLARENGISPGNIQSMLNAGLIKYSEDRQSLSRVAQNELP